MNAPLRAPALRLFDDELIIDNFAGGGGASIGIERATGRSPDYAINHDPEALAQHAVNHPGTEHLCEDVWAVDPVALCAGRKVGLAWFSPDCKHFSKAKGSKPVSKKIRGLAWVVIKWAQAVRPRVIILENVEEFQTWGPVLESGKPCPHRKGLTFGRWKSRLEGLGYVVDHWELKACDYGAPTTRKRFFLVARCDGQPIRKPVRTHGPGLLPYRVAADCIDFALPCPSIFDTAAEIKARWGLSAVRPLAENTLRRIARGLVKFVIEAAEPFIVSPNHTASYYDHFRGQGLGEPLSTITGSNDKALVMPYLTEHANASTQRVFAADEPLRTQCAQVKGGHFALVAPTLVQTGYGEREGQAPRSLDLQKPIGTIVAGATKHALVSAFLAKHYGGHETPGAAVPEPFPTVTARDHNALVASNLVKLKGTAKDGQPITDPIHTVQAGGNHYAEVRAFMVAYYGNEKDGGVMREPVRTITSRERFGLVKVFGSLYAIVDIGMRMLTPRELYRAQGFPENYVIDIVFKGRRLPKDAQVRMCGNSVCPPMAEAMVLAQFHVDRLELADLA